MRAVEVVCPAKVNLFLAVGPPDASGYHPLRTVFQAVSLVDTLTVGFAEGEDEFTCDWEGLPADNTMTKALRLAREFATIPPLRVHLTKRIPAESGLGGGSSDAAGLLRGIAALLPGYIDARDQREIAAAVGADVPFFLVGGKARGEGYGERLTPLPDGEPIWLVLARPNVGVSTPDAYRRLDAAPREWHPFPAEGAPPFNDFESVAPPKCHAVAERLRGLGGESACLSGSGSAVFATFASEAAATSAAKAMQAEACQVWAVRTLTRVESLGVDARC